MSVMKAFPARAIAKPAFKQLQLLPLLPDPSFPSGSTQLASASAKRCDADNGPQIISDHQTDVAFVVQMGAGSAPATGRSRQLHPC
jgi:hypothetical protein